VEKFGNEELAESNIHRGKRQRYPLLDFVRYIAALLVANLHWSLKFSDAYSPLLGIPVIGNLIRNGAIGVPIFFIISGYVILETAWRKNSIDFIVGRFTRLFPGLLICMTLVLAMELKFNDTYFPTPIKSWFNSIFLTYTLTNTKPLAAQLWTLVVEVKFYILIALLLLLLGNKFRSVPLQVSLITVWQLFLVFAPFDALKQYISLGTADFLFGLGVSISMLLMSRSSRRNTLLTFPLAIYFLIRVLSDYRTNHTLLIFFFCTIVAISVSSFGIFGKLPVRFFQYLGQASYLIYLLHVQFGQGFLTIMLKYSNINIYFLVILDIIFITCLSIFIAIFVESKIQNWIRTFAQWGTKAIKGL